MPGLDGFAATKEIMIATPTPIVVVSSTLVGEAEAHSAMLALRAGARELKRVRGRVIAQNRETSVVFGMPGATVAAGLADHVLPIERIADRLLELL